MTVDELINELQKIGDGDLTVFVKNAKGMYKESDRVYLPYVDGKRVVTIL